MMTPLRTLPYWIFGFLVLIIALTIWRWDILVQRPYWGSAMGNFTYASSLAYGDVDASGLDNVPGRSMHEHSFVPYLLAGLLRVLPAGTQVILVFRFLTFACGALGLTLLFWWLMPRVGWGSAAITAAAILTTPVFATQLEQLGLEMFMIAGVVAATVFLFEGWFVLAAIAGLVAFFAKWHAIAYAAAALAYLLVIAFRPGASYAAIVRGFVAHAVVLGIGLAILFWRGHEHLYWQGWVPDDRFGTSPLIEIWRWAPDLLAVIGIGIVVTFFAIPAGQSSAVSEGEPNPRDDLPRLWDGPIAMSFFMLVAIGTLLAIVGAVPGNLALAVPFAVLLAAWVSMRRSNWRLAGTIGFFLLTGFNLVNSAGLFLPAIPNTPATANDWRTGALRERSREYLEDHSSNIQAIIAIVNKSPTRKIVAPAPFVQFLSLPALGYVVEPLEGFSLGGFASERFPPVEELRQREYQRLTIIHVQNRYAVGNAWISPGPRKGDDEIFVDPDDQNVESPLTVFVPRHGFADNPALARLSYLRRFWPSQVLLQEALRYLAENDLTRAESVLRVLLETNPQYGPTRFHLGLIMERRADVAGALEQYDQVPRRAEIYWQAKQQAGSIRLAMGELEKAKQDFAASADAYSRLASMNPRLLATIHVALADVSLRENDFGAAKASLEKALSIDGSMALAARQLGSVLFAENKLDQAEERLKAAADLDAKDPVTHQRLGDLYLKKNEWAKAEFEFSEALTLANRDTHAQVGLAMSLAKQGKYDEAIAEYEDALAPNLDDRARSEILVHFASDLKAAGRWERAVAVLKDALAANPDSKEASNELAWVLATSPMDEIRDGRQAVTFAEKIAAQPDAASAFLDTLAAAYAEVGEFEKAVETIKRAIGRATVENQLEYLPPFHERLALYEQKKAYRDNAGAKREDPPG